MAPSFFQRHTLASIFSASLLLTGIASSSPIKVESRAEALSPVIPFDFPDPSILQDTDGTWYAFSTNKGPDQNVPVANASSPSGPWTRLSNENIFPKPGVWSNGANVWAPDVRKIGSTYVLYYSATDAASTLQHCVGTATATSILGPYTAQDVPIACNPTIGGAIDPAGFTDTDGTNYVVYKVDGNSVGHGGNCGNSVDPIVPTPLMLQQLAADGVTPVGQPIQLLDRGPADGPLIEAPNLLLVNGVYFLFFSSNCFSTTLYDISYATATSVKGPFTKSSTPLAVTDNPFQITSPGGATATVDGKSMVFHGNCDAGRCMFETPILVSGTTVTFI